MTKDFRQIEWDASVEDDCRHIVRLAVLEDLDRLFDWTTVCLVSAGRPGEAAVVARAGGVVAGLPAAQLALAHMDTTARWSPATADGTAVHAGQTLAVVSGSARSLLTAERLLLNLIGRLSGIATLTRRYVDAVSETAARIYDTRKTTPGWRRLEKYAVRAGGGHNHRTGLFDAILIKDNHLALAAAGEQSERLSPADAVRRARRFGESLAAGSAAGQILIEVEVDTLSQLDEVLREGPDLVLLDNMSTEMLRAAVALRNQVAPSIELEASGGVTLDSVLAIARTGVERISVGA